MPTKDIFRERRGRLLKRMARAGVEALLVSKSQNVFYLSGFKGEDSTLLVTPAASWLLTDSRFTEQAEGETRGVRIVTRKKGMMRTAGTVAHRAGVKVLGVEAQTMTLAEAEEIRKWLGKGELKQTSGLVERLRVIKDATEIAAIRRATEIAERAFGLILPELTPGRTEREIAVILEGKMTELGAQCPAFPTIVATNAHASLPHAQPRDVRIRSGDAVLFDWGARWGGYHSDLTRVVFLDRISPVFQRLYSLVLAAQRRALSRVKPGRRASVIDSAARAYLKAHRHGKHFGHGLGHGVGLEVHEAPGIAPRQDVVLKPGMVITIEPGVYLPGRGGVRIEDLVLVTRGGHEILTSTQKSPELVLVRS